MKTATTLVLVALLSIHAYAQQKYVFFPQGSVFYAPNGTTLKITAGDCFPFTGQNNSKISFAIEGIGNGTVTWNTVQVIASNPELVKRTQESVQRMANQYTFEIPDDSSPYNRGGVMVDSNSTYYWQRAIKEAKKVMSRVEAMNLFGIMKREVRTPERMIVPNEAAMPFLGFQGNNARLEFGSSYVTVPADSVEIVSLKQHPELRAQYNESVDAFETRMENKKTRDLAAKQERTLEEINKNLEQIKQLEQLRQLQGNPPRN